jgi:AcrR family transcriptional regulator
MEELILKKAKALFFTYGLKSVSMDDIAKAAAISKKTIYKSFEDKNEIVRHLIGELLLCNTMAIEQCSREAKDAVDEVLQFTGTAFDSMAVISPTFFYELEKFFPSVWQLFTKHRQTVLVPSIMQNLDTGIHEGNYRNNLDVPFIAEIRVQQIATAFYPNSFANEVYRGSRLMMQLSEFYLYGISSEKGKKLITTYLNMSNEKQYSN